MAEPTKAVAIGLTNGCTFQQIRYGWHIGKKLHKTQLAAAGKESTMWSCYRKIAYYLEVMLHAKEFCRHGT